MKRIIPILLTLSLLIGVFCVNASAKAPAGTPINILAWKTGAENIESATRVEGAIRVATSEVKTQTRQWLEANGSVYDYLSEYRNYVRFDATRNPNANVGSYMVAEIYPMGYFLDSTTYNLDRCFSLIGLPNGTNLALDAVVGGGYQGIDFTNYYDPALFRARLEYVDADGNNCGSGTYVDTEYHYDDKLGPMVYCRLTIEAPEKAVAFRFNYREVNQITSINSSDWYYESGITAIKYSYIVNTQEYETALSDFQNSQITDRLDDISSDISSGLHRPVQPDYPSGSEQFEDLHDKEDQLINDAQNYLDSYYELMDSTAISVTTLLPTFTAVKVLLQNLIDIPILKTLVSISLVLGLTGTVLGIGGLIVQKKKGG